MNGGGLRRIKIFLGVLLVVFLFSSFILYKNFNQNFSEKSSIKSKNFVEKIVNDFTNKNTKILFVGDMMFDRKIREITEEKGGDYIFSCIKDLLKSVDFVVGNLEGPITLNNSLSKGSKVGSQNNYRFTFPTTTAKLLKENNFGVVSLGNNHIGNFGQEGVLSTRQYLDEVDVGHFGGLKDDEYIYYKDINNISFAFISYNFFGGNDYNFVAEKIRSENSLGKKVVIFAHWGDEYSNNIENLKFIAKKFVEAGASLIVGSHPHIVLSNENVDDVPVYYSLGNFIFDQYWEESVRNGLAVLFEFEGGFIKTTEYPVEIFRDGRVCIK